MDKSNGQYKFSRVNFLITKFCNLRCRMCDYRIWNFHSKMMSINKIKSVIAEIKELGADTLELSGGEPMVRKDIYEIIGFANSQGLKVHLMTNGILIGKKEAEQLIECGLNAVSISLEGPEAINDKIRGCGNYGKALNALKCFEKYNNQNHIYTSVGITLSKYNYQHILSFCKFLLEDIGIGAITINPYESLMLVEKNRTIRESEFTIDLALMSDFLEKLNGIIKYALTMGKRMPSVNYLQKIPDYFSGKRVVPEGGCFMPQKSCALTMEGFVYPCWKSSKVGDIKQTSLREIINSSAYQRSVNYALNGKCSGCLSSCYAEIY
jgi:MoaA/NifB/PqqE/SkfB family radical SAM enzyme